MLPIHGDPIVQEGVGAIVMLPIVVNDIRGECSRPGRRLQMGEQLAAATKTIDGNSLLKVEAVRVEAATLQVALNQQCVVSFPHPRTALPRDPA